MHDMYDIIRAERARQVKENEAALREAAHAFLKKYTLRLLLGDRIEVEDIRDGVEPLAPELLANYLFTEDSSCAFNIEVFTSYGQRFYFVSTKAR